MSPTTDASGEQSDATVIPDRMEQMQDDDSLRDSFHRQGRFLNVEVRPVTDNKLPLSTGPLVARSAFYDATEGSDLIDMGWEVTLMEDEGGISLTHPTSSSYYRLEALVIWEDDILKPGMCRMSLLAGTLWSAPDQAAPRDCDGEHSLVPSTMKGPPSYVHDIITQIEWYARNNHLDATRSTKQELAEVEEDREATYD